jgi:hypothetical protein
MSFHNVVALAEVMERYTKKSLLPTEEFKCKIWKDGCTSDALCLRLVKMQYRRIIETRIKHTKVAAKLNGHDWYIDAVIITNTPE